ncbi:MAG: membrane protein of unknown function [Nitrosopumilales archaeon]|nr:MAG: membrane protein of unknown function [Nitrosopumilales archaeon]
MNKAFPQIFKFLKRVLIYSTLFVLAKILRKWIELRIMGTRKILKEIGISIIFFIINPALLMGAGFAFITGSVRLEEWSKETGMGILSLYGLLNYETAFEFSTHLHEFLNEDPLRIPLLFFVGMCVLFVQRYRQFSNISSSKYRVIKTLSLTLIEGVILSVVLFGGVILGIAALFPTAISNWNLVLGITLPMIVISPLRGWIAKYMHDCLENNLPQHSTVH